MNEKIKEFIAKATTVEDTYPAGCNGYPTPVYGFDKGKFAELIIQLCIDKCEFVATMAAVTNDDDEMSRKCEATANSCATMIKQHFGVK